MAVLNDRKYYKDTDADDEAEYFDPVFMAATDYYPFGYEMLSALATAIKKMIPTASFSVRHSKAKAEVLF